MSAENARDTAYVVSLANRRSIVILAVAGASVAGVVAVIVCLWHEIGDAQISTAGRVMMALGIVVTLAVGIGLMALTFISSRRGYDEMGTIRVQSPYNDEETPR